MTHHQPRMYYELAEWFTTLTAPEDYAGEADLYHRLIQQESPSTAKTMLELGSGAGNNASHLKHHYEMTLTDLSPAMLTVSKKQNPECKHHVGDMRSLRLHTQFDVVFIHDAIDYITTLDDLKATFTTAKIHCKPDGLIMIVPDYTRETFAPSTLHGGNDAPHSMRYLEWSWQADPDSHIYYSDFAYMHRDGVDVKVSHDRHVCGLFSQDEWLSTFQAVELHAKLSHSDIIGDSNIPQSIFIATHYT